MSEFKVGDVLRVRQWDDMEEEFGLDDFGHIACQFTFTNRMKYMCGETFTIKNIIGSRYYSVENIEMTGGFEFSISKDMLEYAHISDVSLDVDPDDEAVLNEFLTQFI